MINRTLMFYKTKAKTHPPRIRCGREMSNTAKNLVIPHGITPILRVVTEFSALSFLIWLSTIHNGYKCPILRRRLLWQILARFVERPSMCSSHRNWRTATTSAAKNVVKRHWLSILILFRPLCRSIRVMWLRWNAERRYGSSFSFRGER